MGCGLDRTLAPAVTVQFADLWHCISANFTSPYLSIQRQPDKKTREYSTAAAVALLEQLFSIIGCRSQLLRSRLHPVSQQNGNGSIRTTTEKRVFGLQLFNAALQ